MCWVYHPQAAVCTPHQHQHLTMIFTYGRVLSTIEKTLWELMEKYWEVGKSFWNLVEGQKRNIAQLERIGAIKEQKWSLEGNNEKEESRDEEEGFKDDPRES